METIEKAEQHKSKSKATAVKAKESKQKIINIIIIAFNKSE